MVLSSMLLITACSSVQPMYQDSEKIVYNYSEVVVPPVISKKTEETIKTMPIPTPEPAPILMPELAPVNYDFYKKPILESVDEAIQLKISPFNDEVSEPLQFKLGGSVSKDYLEIQNKSNASLYFVAIRINTINQIYKKDGVYKPIQEIKPGERIKVSLGDFVGFNSSEKISSLILSFSVHEINNSVPKGMYNHYVKSFQKSLDWDKDIQSIEYVSK